MRERSDMAELTASGVMCRRRALGAHTRIFHHQNHRAAFEQDECHETRLLASTKKDV